MRDVWHGPAVRTETHRPTLEEWREEIEAERRLAHIDLLEDLAALSEDETCPELQGRFSSRYRQVVGVAPAERREFQAALERIKAGGGMSVEDLIDLMRRNH